MRGGVWGGFLASYARRGKGRNLNVREYPPRNWTGKESQPSWRFRLRDWFSWYGSQTPVRNRGCGSKGDWVIVEAKVWSWTWPRPYLRRTKMSRIWKKRTGGSGCFRGTGIGRGAASGAWVVHAPWTRMQAISRTMRLTP